MIAKMYERSILFIDGLTIVDSERRIPKDRAPAINNRLDSPSYLYYRPARCVDAHMRHNNSREHVKRHVSSLKYFHSAAAYWFPSRP